MALARKVDRLVLKREKKMDVAKSHVSTPIQSDVDRGEYSHSRAQQQVAKCDKT